MQTQLLFDVQTFYGYVHSLYIENLENQNEGNYLIGFNIIHVLLTRRFPLKINISKLGGSTIFPLRFPLKINISKLGGSTI